MPGIVVTGPRQISMSVLLLWRPDPPLTTALSAEFTVAWPTTPNTTAKSGEGVVLWLAPQEWAIIGMPADEVQRRSAAALGQSPHHVVDVSDGRVAFSLKGSWARETISKGCSLDLHPRSFAPGSCAQTMMAQCAVLIHRPENDDHFDIILDASLCGHMQAWLADALVEFTL